MNIKSSIAEEVKQTPLASISGASSAVIATLSLALAWAQYRAGNNMAVSPTPVEIQPHELSLGNVLLALAYFLAVTTAAALFLRALGKRHNTATFFASIPLIALTNFSAILVLYLAPPRKLDSQLFASAHDLIFYASAAIVISFCGSAVIRNILSSDPRKTTLPNDEVKIEHNIGGAIALVAVLLIGWSSLVFGGQIRLTKTLLPEITHPVESKQAKSATPSPSIERVSPDESNAASHIKR